VRAANEQLTLADPRITERKVDRELMLWNENAGIYRRRGWLMLSHEGVRFEVAFLTPVVVSAGTALLATACVRFDYSNYDLWPPSVEFIDLRDGSFATPATRAVVPTDEGPRDLLVDGHPETHRPFFCFPGTREYHRHPQHSGDSWLLHRGRGAASLVTLCDLIWRSMARNVVGVQTVVQALPPGMPIQAQIQIAQGDVDALPKGAAGGDAA